LKLVLSEDVFDVSTRLIQAGEYSAFLDNLIFDFSYRGCSISRRTRNRMHALRSLWPNECEAAWDKVGILEQLQLEDSLSFDHPGGDFFELAIGNQVYWEEGVSWEWIGIPCDFRYVYREKSWQWDRTLFGADIDFLVEWFAALATGERIVFRSFDRSPIDSGWQFDLSEDGHALTVHILDGCAARFVENGDYVSFAPTLIFPLNILDLRAAAHYFRRKQLLLKK
jgi:hypothetical protein